MTTIEPVYATRKEASVYLGLSLAQMKPLAREGLLTLYYINQRTVRLLWSEVKTLMVRKAAYDREKTLEAINGRSRMCQETYETLREFYGDNIPGLNNSSKGRRTA